MWFSVSIASNFRMTKKQPNAPWLGVNVCFAVFAQFTTGEAQLLLGKLCIAGNEKFETAFYSKPISLFLGKKGCNWQRRKRLVNSLAIKTHSLQRRRVRADLIIAFKIFMGLLDVDSNIWGNPRQKPSAEERIGFFGEGRQILE